jgi:sec-independent protein translocase protein TatA
MGIENPVHLIFIAAVALVVLGPKRLPELAKALGHGIREFREAMSQDGAAPAQALVAKDPPESHGQESVDPTQTVRSGDAPDHRPL